MYLPFLLYGLESMSIPGNFTLAVNLSQILCQGKSGSHCVFLQMDIGQKYKMIAKTCALCCILLKIFMYNGVLLKIYVQSFLQRTFCSRYRFSNLGDFMPILKNMELRYVFKIIIQVFYIIIEQYIVCFFQQCPGVFSVAVIDTITKEQLREKSIHQASPSTSQYISTGSQGRHSRQERSGRN